MILPHDAFGRMMRSNLKTRGLTLPGFETWGRSLLTQLERFVGKGEGEGRREEEEGGVWERAIGGDMNAVFDYLLELGDREKAVRLEHLDEVEEWQMLMVSRAEGKAGKGWSAMGRSGGRRLFNSIKKTHEKLTSIHILNQKTGSLLLRGGDARRGIADALAGPAGVSRKG